MKIIDTHLFRPSALHFKKYGRFTNFAIGTTEYHRFWEEEKRRSLEGYQVNDVYIPGYFYFYLNFSPILIVKAKEEFSGKQQQADRLEDFPSFWDSDFEFFAYIDEAEKKGKHSVVLKTRGRGYSFKGASMCCRNYFLIPQSKSYCIASEMEYLTKDGILSKAWNIMDFIDQNTPWAKRRQKKNTDTHRRASYIQTIDNISTEKGYKSEIIGVTLKNDPNKARGKRGKLIIWEEAGKFPHLLQAWQIGRPSMEQGTATFGLMLAFGTGGVEGAEFESLEELFYHGEGYNIHTIENIWDENQQNTKSGYFVSSCMNLEGFYDKDGNSDVVAAKIFEENSRLNVRNNTKDPLALTRYIAENPFTPQEAVMRTQGTKFPINDLKTHLAYIETNPAKYRNADFIGKLVISETGFIVWQHDRSLTPIYKFPHKDNKNLPGAIVIYEHPYTNNQGNIPYGMYIAGIDPYDHDESSTTSLGSIFIMNTLTDRIVAEYTGRPSASEFYEICRRLLIFYNALGNYENDLKGLFTYFENKTSLHLLCEQPRVVSDIEQSNVTKLSRKKGTPGTTKINQYARTLLAEWLTKTVDQETERTNLHTIRSMPLLQELIHWNINGNFDRVSAMGMLMILREDRIRLEIEMENPIKILEQDPFFKRNYKRSSQISYGNMKNSIR